MSFYGTGIIERLPVNSQLQNPNNPMHIIIQNTIGELLDNFENNTNLLCSDNPYVTDELMGFVSDEVYNILDEKFIRIPFRTIIE